MNLIEQDVLLFCFLCTWQASTYPLEQIQIAYYDFEKQQGNIFRTKGTAFQLSKNAFREKYETPYKFGDGTRKAKEVIRKHVDYLEIDRPLYVDHNKMKALVKSCEILNEVEKAIGSLE